MRRDFPRTSIQFSFRNVFLRIYVIPYRESASPFLLKNRGAVNGSEFKSKFRIYVSKSVHVSFINGTWRAFLPFPVNVTIAGLVNRISLSWRSVISWTRAPESYSNERSVRSLRPCRVDGSGCASKALSSSSVRNGMTGFRVFGTHSNNVCTVFKIFRISVLNVMSKRLHCCQSLVSGCNRHFPLRFQPIQEIGNEISVQHPQFNAVRGYSFSSWKYKRRSLNASR